MDKKQAKVAKVMREFKEDKLKSSSGQKVTNPKQAIAIGLSEAGLSKPKKMAAGGSLKEVDSDKNPGLSKLPEDVRNKMGYLKKGGSVKHSDIAKDKPMMEKVAKKAVKGHEKAMHGMKKGGMTCGPATKKMAKGGVTRADGCVSKGHTKGKMVAMKKGGYC